MSENHVFVKEVPKCCAYFMVHRNKMLKFFHQDNYSLLTQSVFIRNQQNSDIFVTYVSIACAITFILLMVFVEIP